MRYTGAKWWPSGVTISCMPRNCRMLFPPSLFGFSSLLVPIFSRLILLLSFDHMGPHADYVQTHSAHAHIHEYMKTHTHTHTHTQTHKHTHTHTHAQVMLPPLSVVECVGVSALLTVGGVMGDLCESLLKRLAGFKDSGV